MKSCYQKFWSLLLVCFHRLRNRIGFWWLKRVICLGNYEGCSPFKLPLCNWWRHLPSWKIYFSILRQNSNAWRSNWNFLAIRKVKLTGWLDPASRRCPMSTYLTCYIPDEASANVTVYGTVSSNSVRIRIFNKFSKYWGLFGLLLVFLRVFDYCFYEMSFVFMYEMF